MSGSAFGKQPDHGVGRFPCPPQFIDQFPSIDHYLAHNSFSNPKTRENFILLLTDRNLYKFTPPPMKRLWVVDLRDLHAVEEGSAHESFHFLIRARKGAALEGFTKPQNEELYSEYLWTEVCFGESVIARDVWCIMLFRVLRITNQRFFENSFVPAPEVFQWCFYLSKLKSKTPSRMRITALVASANRLFLLEVKPGTLELVRTEWAFSVTALLGLLTAADNPLLFAIRVAPSTQAGFGRNKPMPELVAFVARNTAERNCLLADIRRLYRLNASARPTASMRTSAGSGSSTPAELKQTEVKTVAQLAGKSGWLESTAHSLLKTVKLEK